MNDRTIALWGKIYSFSVKAKDRKWSVMGNAIMDTAEAKGASIVRMDRQREAVGDCRSLFLRADPLGFPESALGLREESRPL